MRQLVVSALFSFLLLINLALWIEHRKAALELQESKDHIQKQVDTIKMADSKSSKFSALAKLEAQDTKWIQDRMALIRDKQDFMVRSGEKYVAQVLSGKLNSKEASIKLFCYLPQGDSKVNIAFRKNGPRKSRFFGSPNTAYTWPDQFQVNLESGQVHEFDFLMTAADDQYKLSIKTTGFERDIPMPPFTNPGCSYGPYFAMHHPNTFPVFGSRSRHPMFNLLLDHTFNIREKSKEPTVQSVTILVWLESDDPSSIPITYAMDQFDRAVGSFWFDEQRNPIPKKLTDFLQSYDGTGRVYFQSQ